VGEIRGDLAKQAQFKALEVRRELKLDLKAPICIYDVCEQRGLTVQFVPLNGIEGMYLNEGGVRRILVSALRPLPRKNYTCGHELGHDLFAHGFKVDELQEFVQKNIWDPQEFLVDCFAGFLLMPKIGILNAFTSRNWRPTTANPQQIFAVACSFGVGYSTLIEHMTYTLRLITEEKARELKKSNPKTVRQELLGEFVKNPLMIADEKSLLKTIDVEVGYHLLLPKNVQIEGHVLSNQADLQKGRLFQANRPGVVRAYSTDLNWASFIRVSRSEYTGLGKFRHLEESDDDE
jgi:Zn-dependent peptidase ImmA (M78 family)